jgi:hypothetical protein
MPAQIATGSIAETQFGNQIRILRTRCRSAAPGVEASFYHVIVFIEALQTLISEFPIKTKTALLHCAGVGHELHLTGRVCRMRHQRRLACRSVNVE